MLGLGRGGCPRRCIAGLELLALVYLIHMVSSLQISSQHLIARGLRMMPTMAWPSAKTIFFTIWTDLTSTNDDPQAQQNSTAPGFPAMPTPATSLLMLTSVFLYTTLANWGGLR